MVAGLEKFREYFYSYDGCYLIIGGTACDILISESGLIPRATKDIDIILIVEAINPEFVQRFWEFVQEGGYEIRERSDAEHKYYRFAKPGNPEFPKMVEIFSRNPDIADIKEGSHLTPVPVSDDVPSLSAILLDEEYYRFTLDNSTLYYSIRIAKTEALICLKAKAFLDLTKRKVAGEEINSRIIRKHKLDIFRLAALLKAEDSFDLPDKLKEDMRGFADQTCKELPGNEIFKDMGLPEIDVEQLFEQLIKSFNLISND